MLVRDLKEMRLGPTSVLDWQVVPAWVMNCTFQATLPSARKTQAPGHGARGLLPTVGSMTGPGQLHCSHNPMMKEGWHP